MLCRYIESSSSSACLAFVPVLLFSGIILCLGLDIIYISFYLGQEKVFLTSGKDCFGLIHIPFSDLDLTFKLYCIEYRGISC